MSKSAAPSYRILQACDGGKKFARNGCGGSDLNRFQTLSKNVSGGQYPNEHLFDYLDNRSRLAPQARNQLDIAEITEQLRSHPDQPEGLYLLG